MTNIKRYGEQKEKEYSKKRNDFTRHRSSGTSRFEEGDGHNDFFVEDIKSTEGKAIKVTLEMLQKISDEANRVEKTGVITLQFGDVVYYVIPETTYNLLKTLLEEYEKD